jgi:hypothetical protein
MSYYIPVSGKTSQSEGHGWLAYWARMPNFESYDCFDFSSADMNNPLHDQFEPVVGMNIESFKEQVLAQQMADVSYTMGCWPMASIIRYSPTNHLYLSHGFTGGCYLFKLHES